VPTHHKVCAAANLDQNAGRYQFLPLLLQSNFKSRYLSMIGPYRGTSVLCTISNCLIRCPCFLHCYHEHEWTDLIAASVNENYQVGPSIRPICIRCYFTMTNTIQVCSNFYEARVFITNTRPEEICESRCVDSQLVQYSSLPSLLLSRLELE